MSASSDMLARGQQQWNDATTNARMNIDSMLRAAGVVKRNPATGDYTSQSASDAFNPSSLMDANGKPKTLSSEEMASMTSGTTYGSVGGFSEAYQAGANTAGDTAANTASAGLSGGGLAAQRQELALASTKAGVKDVTTSLMGGLGTQYGNVATGYNDYQTNISDATTLAASETTVDPTATPTTPAALPSIKDSEIQGAYRGTKQERITKMRALIAEKSLTPKQQTEVQRLLKQSGFKWDIPAS